MLRLNPFSTRSRSSLYSTCKVYDGVLSIARSAKDKAEGNSSKVSSA